MPETPPTHPAGPPLPWKTKLFTAAISVLTDAVRRRDGTVNRGLLSLFDVKAPPNSTPVDGVTTSDHTVDPTRNLWIRLFSPTPASSDHLPLPVIVYFHGGGFALHSAASRPFDRLCRRLARRVPAYVVSVEYRLSPEHRCPAPYDDGIDVLRWLDGGDLVPDLSVIFLAGDSAGGNIAHHVARRATAEEKELLRKAKVAGLVAIQPFFGGEEETESEVRLAGAPFGSRERLKWMWRSFLPEGSDLNHEAANVFGPGWRSGSGDWTGFPATMVCIGGWDGLQDRQRRYCEGLKGVGVEVCTLEYQNAVHGFYAFKELPEVEQVIGDIADFVRRRSEESRSEN